jgi:ATP/maltotriose-dependent transcriptional regulator MalT
VVAPAAPEPPGPDDERVERPLVDELINRAVKRRICVVIGAAGWGKTTAVAAWSRGRRTAWVRHEDHEGNADHLLVRLVEAVQSFVSPTTAGQDATAVLTSQHPQWRHYVPGCTMRQAKSWF